MENQLVVKPQMQVSEIMVMAKTFAESGMFTDAKQAAQAFVKIQAGQEIGVPPFAAMSGIHIIQGKPTLGAGLMASTVKGHSKYDYKVKSMNDTICEIEFLEGKESLGVSKFTIEEARKAGTKNLDKFPKNMLFARAMSNGVKFYCPDVFNGPVYVPEEMDFTKEITEDVKHEVIDENKSLLENCSDVESLGKAYKSLSKTEQIRLKELTNNLKTKLATPSNTETNE